LATAYNTAGDANIASSHKAGEKVPLTVEVPQVPESGMWPLFIVPFLSNLVNL